MYIYKKGLVTFNIVNSLITVYITKNDRSLKWSRPPCNEVITLFYVCVIFIYMYDGVCINQLD